MNHEDGTRLGVGIVGVGRVGAVMGAALREAGHQIVGVSAGSEASRERADALLPGAPILDVETLVGRSELILLTVPDDEIAPLVEGLAALGRFSAGQIVMHCAGRHGLDVLAPAAAAGAIPLALHPSLAFTGTSMDLPRLREATIGVTAPRHVLPIGQALVVEIGAEPVVLKEADRALYHAAIAHAANHTAVIVAQAMDVLREVGVEDPARVLSSLVHASASNILQSGPQALTGPVSRGDVGTVRAHMEALAEYAVSADSAEVRDSYAAMGRATTARALANGTVDEPRAAALMDVLGEGGPRD
ncbi:MULTISPECIES: Rossmann-like and DUF2520 domain-containing protein [Brevibacterium]|uniref:DUF2520 domain-containing protein n=1 Tax=Brevibacterium salitolerans TaxID=1403566 RepID=A0ABN2WV95_9MICO|nr:DUF2520 domain-containing protein [Brevibacterium sp.]